MSSNVLVVAALGRPFTLGTLYDARQDKLNPGFTLWEDNVLQESTVESSQPSSAFEIIASDSIEDKSDLLDVEAALKASFLGGLVEVGGSAKYLNDTKKFKNQSRVTLQYKATTHFKQLMTNLGTTHVEYSKLLENVRATHVVIGILYGANAFFVFDSDKVDSSNVQEIQGNMEAVIKKIPSAEIAGQGAVQLTSEESAITNSFSCKFHGDFFLTSNPTTFEDAVQTYQQLPQMTGKEKTVPITVWLVPLTNFYPEAPQVVADSSTPVLRKVRNTLEAVRQLEMRCNDSLDDKIVTLFPQIKTKLTNFQNLFNDYMLNFRQTIAKKLLSLRSGVEDENALLALFEENLNSPFNIESLNKWMDCEEREINVIRSCIDIVEEAKPKIVSGQSELHSQLLDSKVQHTLCFAVTILGNSDPYLDVLSNYLESPQSVFNPKDFAPSAEGYWYTSDDLPKIMREKAHHFRDLAKVLGSRYVQFLVTSLENREPKGAGVHYYKGSILMKNDYTIPPLRPVVTIDKRRELLWYYCDLTLDPDTAFPGLTLSEGNKKAVPGTRQSYADKKERFDGHQQVMCKEGLSGRHYWEIEWSGFARAGVTYRGISRKGFGTDASLGNNEKSWAFDYYPPFGYSYMYCGEAIRVDAPSHGFNELGIFLDWPAGTLSFYMVSSNSVTHLHTFPAKFTEALYPAFQIGFPDMGSSGQIKLL